MVRHDATPGCFALLSGMAGGCLRLEGLLPNVSVKLPSNAPFEWIHCKAIKGLLSGDCYVAIESDMLLIRRQPDSVDEMILLSDAELTRDGSYVGIFHKGTQLLLLRCDNLDVATRFEANARAAMLVWAGLNTRWQFASQAHQSFFAGGGELPQNEAERVHSDFEVRLDGTELLSAGDGSELPPPSGDTEVLGLDMSRMEAAIEEVPVAEAAVAEATGTEATAPKADSATTAVPKAAVPEAADPNAAVENTACPETAGPATAAPKADGPEAALAAGRGPETFSLAVVTQRFSMITPRPSEEVLDTSCRAGPQSCDGMTISSHRADLAPSIPDAPEPSTSSLYTVGPVPPRWQAMNLRTLDAPSPSEARSIWQARTSPRLATGIAGFITDEKAETVGKRVAETASAVEKMKSSAGALLRDEIEGIAGEKMRVWLPTNCSSEIPTARCSSEIPPSKCSSEIPSAYNVQLSPGRTAQPATCQALHSPALSLPSALRSTPLLMRSQGNTPLSQGSTTCSTTVTPGTWSPSTPISSPFPVASKSALSISINSPVSRQASGRLNACSSPAASKGSPTFAISRLQSAGTLLPQAHTSTCRISTTQQHLVSRLRSL